MPRGQPGVKGSSDWRDRVRPSRRSLVESADLFHAVTFATAECASRLLPEPRWRGFARRFASASQVIRRGRADACDELLGVSAKSHLAADLHRRDLITSITSSYFEERLIFRKMARQPAWRPEVRLEGTDHLDAALTEGRGAVLWVAPMIFATLVVKVALHDAGYRVGHLSVPWHGRARTRLGRWLVNERDARVEGRFADRVVIPEEGRMDRALAALRQRLRRNEVVTITAVSTSDNAVDAPFLAGRIRVGPGAPRLALATGAALLAVVMARDGGAAFRVKLHPLLASGSGRAGKSAVQDLTTAFAEAYGHAVIENPALWAIFGSAHGRATASPSER